jgi:hypothetical protein
LLRGVDSADSSHTQTQRVRQQAAQQRVLAEVGEVGTARHGPLQHHADGLQRLSPTKLVLLRHTKPTTQTTTREAVSTMQLLRLRHSDCSTCVRLDFCDTPPVTSLIAASKTATAVVSCNATQQRLRKARHRDIT